MAEITTTQSFSDGDTVTATKLNNIQANASIQPEAITNRSAETSIDQSNDLLLVYDASATALKKVSPSNLIKAGTASDFPITGNATIGGTLGVTGTSALTGNTTIGGTLGVTGAITATSTINGTTIPTTKTLVTTVDTQTLTNKTLTTPVISSITNTGTLTLPTSTDTLVGRTTTDTLTNKTLTSPSISDPSITGQTTASTGIINIGSGQIYKDASGNVGIGTASPTAGSLVHVVGSLIATGLVTSRDTTNLGVQIGLGGSVAAGGASVAAGIYADANGFGGGSDLIIRPRSDSSAGALRVYTGSAGGTERLRIDSSGNVGINTTSASAKLDTQTTGDAWAGRFLNASGSGTPNGLQVVVGQNATNAVFDVAQGTSYTSTSSLFRILGNGNVGIGTTSPQSVFHVSKPSGIIRLDNQDGNYSVWQQTSTDTRFGSQSSIPVAFYTNSIERLRIASDGQIGIGGANYGSSGQVLTSGGASAAPSWTTIQSGKILQVVSVTKTDVFSTTSTSFTDITGLSASITPSSTSNKILVICNVSGSVSGDSNRGLLRLLSGTNAIAIGDAASNRSRSSCAISSYSWMALSASVTHLDSPLSTSSKTYKMQVLTNTGTVYINRTGSDADSADAPRTVSSITLMEVLP